MSWGSSLASSLPIHWCNSIFIASSAMLTHCFVMTMITTTLIYTWHCSRGRNCYAGLAYPRTWFSDLCVAMHLFCSIRLNLGIYEKCTQLEPIMRSEHNSSTQQCRVDTLFYVTNHSSCMFGCMGICEGCILYIRFCIWGLGVEYCIPFRSY